MTEESAMYEEIQVLRAKVSSLQKQIETACWCGTDKTAGYPCSVHREFIKVASDRAEKAEAAEAKAVKRIGELEERVKAAEAVGNWALAVKLDGNTREWLLGLEKMVETYNCKYPTSVEAGTEKPKKCGDDNIHHGECRAKGLQYICSWSPVKGNL